MDQHRHLLLAQAEGGGDLRVQHPGHPLHLEEVVARAQGPQLVAPALARALGDRAGVGAREAAGGLGVGQVMLGSDPVVAQQGFGALLQDGVQRAAGQRERAAVPGAHGDAARDLVHQRLAAVAQLLRRDHACRHALEEEERPQAALAQQSVHRSEHHSCPGWENSPYAGPPLDESTRT